jgi:hypothetical protein
MAHRLSGCCGAIFKIFFASIERDRNSRMFSDLFDAALFLNNQDKVTGIEFFKQPS